MRCLIGLAWLFAWSGLLYLAYRPWLDLGGLVTERLRWWARWALWGGLVIGSTAGELARGTPPLPRKMRRLRGLLYPVSAAAAAAMVGLRWAGNHDPIGVLLLGWLSYSAGATTAFLGPIRSLRRSRAAEADSGEPLA